MNFDVNQLQHIPVVKQKDAEVLIPVVKAADEHDHDPRTCQLCGK
jgi:hypothetical protein